MKKIGQGFFGDYKPNAPTPAAPAASGFFSGVNSTPQTATAPVAAPKVTGPVAKMQSELGLLYQTLKSKPEIAQFFSREHEAAPGTSEFSHGADPFLQFMLNRYVDKSKKGGEQFNLSLPDAKDYAIPGKQLPKSSFLQYLEMLKIVGHHGTKEEVRNPDNNWDSYTDNSLRAAWAIGYAMSTLSGKLQENFSFTKDDLEKLGKLIPDSPEELKELGPEAKNKLAENITPLIVKLKRSVNDFVALMTDASHKYSQYISEGKTFDVLKNQEQTSLSRKDQLRKNELLQAQAKIPNVFIPEDVATGEGEKFPITFNDIANTSNFIKYLNDNEVKVRGMDASKGDGVRVAANYLKRQITLALNAANSPDGF